jgi:hypothetical protein
MDHDELKAQLKFLNDKPVRTEEDLYDLYEILSNAGISAFVCGYKDEDIIQFIKALGSQTQDNELKVILGELWDKMTSETFVTPVPKPPQPRPF